MADPIPYFRVGELYSNEEIFTTLSVGNAGGVRVCVSESGDVKRAVLFTSLLSAKYLAENPYGDRIEEDTLTYTGAGRARDQVVSGVNGRILQQRNERFPIYGFGQAHSRRETSAGKKRWAFLGLLEYIRSYREQQIGADGDQRNVWMFELRIHSEPHEVSVSNETDICSHVLGNESPDSFSEEAEVISSSSDNPLCIEELEPIRRRLLTLHPREFELLLCDALRQSGFANVEVTKYSQDGGVDALATPGAAIWPLKQLKIQLQAKRWLHTVGRKEVAELRGSIVPHAAGCIVTTSHFSRAALSEATAAGKAPITTIDGYEFSSIVRSGKISLDNYCNSNEKSL